MKKFTCVLLVLCMLLSSVSVVFAAESRGTEAADALYELGLFKGTSTNSDGSPVYSLDKSPTRNQALIMLVRLLGKEEEALAGEWEIPFTDVKESVAPYVGYAYANGLTYGTTATTFSGSKLIPANQYITFVLRALGYSSSEDFKLSTAIEFAKGLGITDGVFGSSFLRSDVAIISRNALSAKMKNTETTLLEFLTAQGAIKHVSKIKTAEDLAWESLESKGLVQKEGGLETVTITLPADFIGEITQSELDADPDKDYVDAKLNDDGSVSFRINKEQYKEMMVEVVEAMDESLDELIDSGDFSFTEIRHNEDFTVFDVTIAGEELELADAFAAILFYMFAGIYGLFTGVTPEDVVINFYDAGGRLIESTASSDMA